VLDKQIEALRSISSLEFFSVGALFIGLISPGYLGLLVFAPQLLKEMSFVTTLFVSISFSVPIMLPFIIAVGGIVKSEQEMNHAIFFSIGVASVPFYIWLLVAATLGISWQIFLWVLVCVEGALALYCAHNKQESDGDAA